MKPGSKTHALFFALYGHFFNNTMPIVKYPRSHKSKARYSLLWQTKTKGAQLTVPKMINLADIKVPKEWIIDVRALKQLDVPHKLTTIASIHENTNEAHISFEDSRPSSSSSSSYSTQSSSNNLMLTRSSSTLSRKTLPVCSHDDDIPNPTGPLFWTSRLVFNHINSFPFSCLSIKFLRLWLRHIKC